MRFVAPHRLLQLLLAALALAGCTDGGQTGDEDTPHDGGASSDFFDKLGGNGFGNYEPAGSLRELFDWSDAVIVGRVERVERGRTFVSAGGNQVDSTLVVHLHVLERFKGEPDATLYLEVAFEDAELLTLRVPQERVVLFAKPSQRIVYPGGSIENEGLGLPEGETLRVITTPQGLVWETPSGGVGQLFEGDHLLRGQSLDEVIERVRSTAAAIAATGDAAVDDGGSLSDASAADDGGELDIDASLDSDAGTGGDAGARIEFLQPMFFSLPLDSIRMGVSGYDAQRDLCISVIWYLDTVAESRFCEIIDPQALLPYVMVAPGMPAGCWDYGSINDTAILAQRGCTDFGDLADLADDSVDMEVDVESDAFTGTVLFRN